MKRLGRYTPEGRARRRASYWLRVAARFAAARCAREIFTGKPRPYVYREPP